MALPGGRLVSRRDGITLGDDDRSRAWLTSWELRHRHRASQVIRLHRRVVSAALLGDVSASRLAAAIPTVSRIRATPRLRARGGSLRLRLLKAGGRSPRLLGDALAAMEKKRTRRGSQECRPEPDTRDDAPYLGYLSTHPATEERIRDATAAAQ